MCNMTSVLLKVLLDGVVHTVDLLLAWESSLGARCHLINAVVVSPMLRMGALGSLRSFYVLVK